MTQYNPENPEANEQANVPNYETVASSLIASAEELSRDDLTPLKEAAQAFIEGTLRKADAGEVTSSDGTVYSRETLMARFKKLDEELSKPVEGRSPLMNIPYWGKMRFGFNKLLDSRETGAAFMDALTATIQEHDKNKETLDAGIVEEVGEIGVETYALNDTSELFDPVLDAAKRVVEGVSYDDLLSGKELVTNSTEDAAVRTKSEEELRAAERKASDAEDAANRSYKRPEMN